MKRAITALALSVLASSALISPANAAVDESTCRSVKGLAETLMSSRQAGVDVVDMIDIANKYEGNLGSLTKAMTIDAFKVPAFSTPEYKEKAAKDFGTRHYLNCIKSIK